MDHLGEWFGRLLSRGPDRFLSCFPQLAKLIHNGTRECNKIHKKLQRRIVDSKRCVSVTSKLFLSILSLSCLSVYRHIRLFPAAADLFLLIFPKEPGTVFGAAGRPAPSGHRGRGSCRMLQKCTFLPVSSQPPPVPADGGSPIGKSLDSVHSPFGCPDVNYSVPCSVGNERLHYHLLFFFAECTPDFVFLDLFCKYSISPVFAIFCVFPCKFFFLSHISFCCI